MKKILHYIYTEPIYKAKFYNTYNKKTTKNDLSNQYLFLSSIVADGIPFFMMTPAEAFAILAYGIYDKVDVYLTEANMAYYEGDNTPGSVTGWICLNECSDGEHRSTNATMPQL